jgi:glycosyltransferase involved in cell wall biosynthesis
VSAVTIAINGRFLPGSPDASYSVGAAGFALSAASLLARHRLFGGFLVFVRDETIASPSIGPCPVHGFAGVEVRFNFRMSPERVRDAVAAAVAWHRDSDETVVYYQSNTLLPFHPAERPFLITHHGPFASEIVRLFGVPFAIAAFQGGEDKVAHLIRVQAHGLRILRDSPHGMALELASVQEHYLLRQGIPRDRIRRIAPPCDLDDREAASGETVGGETVGGETVSDETVSGEIVNGDSSLHVMTAVARADAFKDLPLLIAAANMLVERGAALRLSVFAGTDAASDASARAALLESASAALKPRMLIAPRLSHDRLVRYFHTHRASTVFVCTSRYETFGLTPFEAILAGMLTFIPDRPATIGVAEYVVPAWRFRPDPAGLAAALTPFCLHRPDLPSLGARQIATAHTRTAPCPLVTALGAVLQSLDVIRSEAVDG